MVDPVVAVRTLLLRQALPDVPLRAGATVVARVAARGEHQGVLVLAGVPLTATLPDEVPEGATLRLRVREITPERVTLQLEGMTLPAALAPAPAEPRPQERVEVDDPPRRRAERGEEVASVALAFTSPRLGRLDLRIDLAANRVEVAVAARPGEPFDRAQAQSERLRAKMEDAVGRSATVRVRPRREPVDVYA
jgi:hypothetical protein